MHKQTRDQTLRTATTLELYDGEFEIGSLNRASSRGKHIYDTVRTTQWTRALRPNIFTTTWAFVSAKAKNVSRARNAPLDAGDVWTYMAKTRTQSWGICPIEPRKG